MPSYFRMLACSIGSVFSLELRVKASGATVVVLVGDKAFCSHANTVKLEGAGMHYVLPLRRDSALIDYGGMKSSMKSFTHFLFLGRPMDYDRDTEEDERDCSAAGDTCYSKLTELRFELISLRAPALYTLISLPSGSRR